MPEFRIGKRIAIDFGNARIGVALSSSDGLIASPLSTVTNDNESIAEILKLISENGAFEIYVGLPLNLHGEHTKSTELAIDFAKLLSSQTDVPVRLVDERMSTRAAQGQLFASGKNTKQSKGLIDAAAASLILESALAIEKNSGRVPGTSVTEF